MRPSKACPWILALAVVAALSATPVAAGELPVPPTPRTLTGTPAPGQADCGLNLEMVLPGKASVCPAPQNAVAMPALPALDSVPALPEFMAGFRTCRCSCGAPCKTDADCGPGGICGAGITCC